MQTEEERKETDHRWYLANREKCLERSHAYYVGHRDELHTYEQNYFKIEKNVLHRREKHEERKEIIHGQNIAKYGITKEQYDEMFANQGGKCAVCGGQDRRGVLCVDHDHATGKVRGLLCNNCNATLGHAHDRPDILLGLAEYLKTH